MNKKFYRKIMMLVVLLMLVFTTYGYLQLQEEQPIVSLAQDALNNEEEKLDEQEEISAIEKLSNEYHNSDIKAILSIENSEQTYPIVQTTDNEYYLSHNYRKEKDALGAVYADYRVNLEAGKKILIFGHSSTITTVPFNELEKYYDEDYYQNHKYITLETKTNTYRYEIFSVYVETSDFTYMNVLFDNQAEWDTHIIKLQSKSMYFTNVELNEDEDILIMQTCSNHPEYQNNSKKYLLIV